MSERERIIRETLTRGKVAGRRVFGFTTDTASCAELPKGGAPVAWDRICVEADKMWTWLPAASEAAGAA